MVARLNGGIDMTTSTGLRGLKINARFIIRGLLLVLAVVVVIQNTASVETKILFTSISMPRALLLSLAALIGYVIGVMSRPRAVVTAGVTIETPEMTDSSDGSGNGDGAVDDTQ
jgi:uncharacterized integral membrane protein